MFDQDIKLHLLAATVSVLAMQRYCIALMSVVLMDCGVDRMGNTSGLCPCLPSTLLTDLSVIVCIACRLMVVQGAMLAGS